MRLVLISLLMIPLALGCGGGDEEKPAADADAALQVDAAAAPAPKRPGGLRAGFLIAGSRIFRPHTQPRVRGYAPVARRPPD